MLQLPEHTISLVVLEYWNTLLWNTDPCVESACGTAGNKFCGTVPTMLDGVVRDLTAIIGDTEVLTNVTQFSLACDSGRSISKGAIAGVAS